MHNSSPCIAEAKAKKAQAKADAKAAKNGGSANPSRKIEGTSYDVNKMKKTQPYTFQNTVEKYKKQILAEGPNSIDPIRVRVHNGEALIENGHHRFEAFLQLGYDRVPIEYLHKSQLGKTLKNGDYIRSLEEMLDGLMGN